MATRRTKDRESTVLVTEFRVPMSDVLALLDDPDIEEGDAHSAQSDGDELVVTRVRRTVLLGLALARARSTQ